MSQEDLKPLKPKGDTYSDSIRAKLKGSSSNKRKIAQKISGLKRANPENVERKLLALISNPMISALEIMSMIEAVKHNENLRPEVVIQLINSAIKAHSTIFGTKTFNVNMDVSPQSSKSISQIYLSVIEEQEKDKNKELEETQKEDVKRN